MLGSALRDRAVVLGRTRSGTRNSEGGYDVTNDAPGPAFRCLYDPGTESEQRDSHGVRRVRPASLLVGKYALDGTVLQLQPQDRVQITSPAHGTLVLEIVGTPEPIVKRRTRLGAVAQLQRVGRSDAA